MFYRIVSFVFLVCHGWPVTQLDAQCNQLYEWTTWTSFAGNSANGTINYGGQTVGVDMSANYGFGSTPQIYNFGAFNGFGGTIPNSTVPYTTWAAGPGGVTTMCFSQTVTNPVLLIASLGNQGNHVTLEFSLPYAVVYDGGGMTFVSATTLIGAEGYAIIEFPGDFDCVTIYSSTPEWYTNITWGLHPPLFQVDIAGDPAACGEVNLTASGGNTYAWSGGENPNQPSNTFTESGNYFLTVTDNAGCTVLTSVEVDVFQPVQENLYDEICEGVPFYFQGNPVSESGTYTATLQTSHGCDSTITLELVVYPEFQFTENMSLCQGESLLFHGQNLIASGQYLYTEQTQYGCDSIHQLNLVVWPVSNTAINLETCFGDTTQFAGQNLTMPGTYTTTLANRFGCDSLVSLYLSILPPAVSAKDTSICEGDTLLFDNQRLTRAGIYTNTYSTIHGCDSLVTLHLTLNDAPVSQQSATICEGESYLFQGQQVTSAGQYVKRFPSSKGCDSLVVFTLEVLPSPTTLLFEQICQNETRNFGGKILSQSGIYRDTVLSFSGCDSIVVLHLNVNKQYKTTLKNTICNGETVLFHNQSLTQSGEYTVTLPTLFGCDSVIALTLTVLPEIQKEVKAAICQNESFLFHDQLLKEAGTYQRRFLAATGCDSIVTLTLQVLPFMNSSQQANICEGEAFSFHGKWISNPGTYHDTLQVATGCDSIVELTLHVFTPSSTLLAGKICEGESFFFQGTELQKEGQFTKTLTSMNGCDSTITLALQVFPTYRRESAYALCPGASISIENTVLSQAGLWSFPMKTTEGCDSVAFVTITVHPEFEIVHRIETEHPYEWDINGQTYLQSGTYTALFESVTGCDSLHVLELRIIPVKKWIAPNIITVSGPNARFTLFGNEQLDGIRTLFIYDRWGNLVSNLENLSPGDQGSGWDGRSPGGECIPGVYVFVADLSWKDGTIERVSGDVTLLR